jgi:hypothetical protein
MTFGGSLVVDRLHNCMRLQHSISLPAVQKKNADAREVIRIEILSPHALRATSASPIKLLPRNYEKMDDR